MSYQLIKGSINDLVGESRNPSQSSSSLALKVFDKETRQWNYSFQHGPYIFGYLLVSNLQEIIWVDENY